MQRLSRHHGSGSHGLSKDEFGAWIGDCRLQLLFENVLGLK